MKSLESNQELLALIETHHLERPHIVIGAKDGEYELAPVAPFLDWANDKGEMPLCFRIAKGSNLADGLWTKPGGGSIVIAASIELNSI
jgi:hypothetical protein